MKRNERLKSQKLIEYLFREGKSFAAFPIRVYYTINPQLGTASPVPFTLQMGVSASSRVFKKAVHRNRIKRLIREAYRLQKKQLQADLHHHQKRMVLFFIYTGKELPDFNLVFEKMGVILQKLLMILHENIASNS